MFVPDADVVGDVNRGWLVARATLGNERISIGGGSAAPTGFTADDLIKLLDSAPAETAANYVRRAGEVIAETHTLRLLNLRRVSRAIAGAEPGPEGNVTKLLMAEQSQRLTELGMELAGFGRRRRTDAEADAGLSRQPGHDHRRRHVGDHPQHHRRTHSRVAARPAAQVGAAFVRATDVILVWCRVPHFHPDLRSIARYIPEAGGNTGHPAAASGRRRDSKVGAHPKMSRC